MTTTSLSDVRVTFPRVVRSEWVKLRTLRSSWITMLAAVVAIIGIGFLVTYETSTHIQEVIRREGSINALERSLPGVFLAQLAVGVLGVLFVTGEYGTGMIRSTLAAVPRRLPVVAAKLTVFATVTALVTTASVFVAFLGGQSFLGSYGVKLGDPEVARALVGAGLYLTVLAVFAVGLGFALRSTAGGISALFGVLFVLPIVMRFLPSSWQDTLLRYLPSEAGPRVFGTGPHPGMLGPWAGLGVFALWAAASVLAGAVVLTRRDA